MNKSIKFGLVLSQFGFFLLIPVLLELIAYLHPIVIAVVWFCFTAFILFTICWITNEKILVPPFIFHLVTFLYLGSLLVLLFFRPANQTYGSISLLPFETIFYYFSGEVQFLVALYNLAANIGLFVPFGLYYRYVIKKPTLLRLLGISIVAICVIEGMQFLTKRGSLDIDDLILNVAGFCIGYLLQPFVKKVVIVRKEV